MEFVVLVALMLITRFADLFVTFSFSPDLSLEANPVVGIMGWSGFVGFSLTLVISVSICLYYDLFSRNTRYPEQGGLPFSDFAPIHWFGRKRHVLFFLLAFAKDWDLRIKFIGFAGSRLLVFIGIVASASWIGLVSSERFEALYNAVFPFFPYGLIIVGAVFLLFGFLKKEFRIYSKIAKKSDPSG